MTPYNGLQHQLIWLICMTRSLGSIKFHRTITTVIKRENTKMRYQEDANFHSKSAYSALDLRWSSNETQCTSPDSAPDAETVVSEWPES